MSDKYIGDFKKGQQIRVKFNTFSQALIPTAPSVALEVAIYKDSATEITTTGITQPTPNFDSKNGLHELVVDTSDSVYEIGKDYDIVFTAGTVDGIDLTRTILRTFSIENRNTDANVTRIAGQAANAASAVTFPASVANETTVSNRPTLTQIEGSTVLAKDSTVAKDATVAKDSTVAKDATVAKDSTVAKDATVAKEATLVNRPTLTQIEGSTVLAKKSDVPTASAIADAVLEESVDAHDNVAHSLAKYISIIKKANTVIDGVVTSATTPSTTSFSSNVNYPTGAFKHAVLLFTNAAAINEQNSPLLTYVNTNGVITVEEPFTTAPTVGDEFIIIPTNHVHSIAAIQNGLATSTALAAVAANVTALVTRIPATLFAGITSLANWLGAIAGKTADSTTRSQINATTAGANFNETTDSLEAIRDRGDAAWITGATGQGSGARIVTITVRDSSASPVEAATVRVYRAGETYAGVTNASGVTSFSLDDATFTVAITAAGFSFTPVSLVVSGNVSQTYTLTSTGGVTPSVAPRTTGFWTCLSALGVAEPGAQVTIQASSPPSASTGLVMEDAPRTATADNQGIVQFPNLIKGATYIVYRTGSSRKYNVVVPATAGDSIALGSIVG
jgi:hypothetical protein